MVGILSHSPEGIQLGLKSAGSLLAVPKQLCGCCAHTGRAVQHSAGRLQKAEGSLCVCPEQPNTTPRAQSPWEAAPKCPPAQGGEHPGGIMAELHVPRLYLHPNTGVMCSRCPLAIPVPVVDRFIPGWVWGMPLGTRSHSPEDLLVCIPSSHAHYVSLWERSPGTGNPAKSLLCPLQDCPQVQWPTGSRSRDSEVHPHSLKATESPAPISASFRRKPSILCFFCWLKLQS